FHSTGLTDSYCHIIFSTRREMAQQGSNLTLPSRFRLFRDAFTIMTEILPAVSPNVGCIQLDTLLDAVKERTGYEFVEYDAFALLTLMHKANMREYKIVANGHERWRRPLGISVPCTWRTNPRPGYSRKAPSVFDILAQRSAHCPQSFSQTV